MTIREATAADVPAIVAMGCQFLRETAYGLHVQENPSQMAILVESLIDGAGAVFVAERDGGYIGMLGLVAFSHPMSGEPFASEMFWWVDPAARRSGAGARLFARGEQWARDERGVAVLQMIAPTPDVEGIYESRGYTRVEVAYQKRFPAGA